VALTDPNIRYHTPTGNIELMVDTIEALCGGVGSIPSTTTWTVIDSWDGTSREVPTDNLLANATTDWAPGGAVPVSGSWIVLQCQSGERTTVHQSKWTVTGSTANVQLIPYADWTPGGGTGASPTLPTRITTTTSLNLSVGSTPRSLVWDESMVAIAGLYPAGVSVVGVYLGEVHPYADEVDFPRPFVHVRVTGTTGWDGGSWVHYSPFDDTTQCSATGLGYTLSGQNNADFPSYGAFLTPVRLYSTQAGQSRPYIGVARHIANIPRPHTTARTTWGLSLGVRDWASMGTTSNHLAIRHDETTALDFDELRTPLAEDLEIPSGYSLVRNRPRMVRSR